MPLQFLEVGFHVEIHAIEWHDFERDTQFHGVVVARIEFSLKYKYHLTMYQLQTYILLIKTKANNNQSK